LARDKVFGFVCAAYQRCFEPKRAGQRQEGSGTGDGERLRERRKALKGESRKWIRYEIRPADMRADKDAKRLRKPEGVGGERRQRSLRKPLPAMGKHYGETNLVGGSQQAHASFEMFALEHLSGFFDAAFFGKQDVW